MLFSVWKTVTHQNLSSDFGRFLAEQSSCCYYEACFCDSNVILKTWISFCSVGQCKQVINIHFLNWGACPWSPLAFSFGEWHPFSHSHPFLCSDRWSLTSSGTPVVKHSAPNLWEQSSQCVGSLQATETRMMTRMNLSPMSWLLWIFFFFFMPLDDYTRAEVFISFLLWTAQSH